MRGRKTRRGRQLPGTRKRRRRRPKRARKEGEEAKDRRQSRSQEGAQGALLGHGVGSRSQSALEADADAQEAVEEAQGHFINILPQFVQHDIGRGDRNFRGQEQSAKVSRAGAGRVGGPIDAQHEGVCPSSPRLHVEPGRTKSSTNHVSIHPALHSAEVQRRPTSRSHNSRLCLCGRSPPASSPCRGARRRGATPEELGDDHRRSTMDHRSENTGGTRVTGDNGLPGRGVDCPARGQTRQPGTRKFRTVGQGKKLRKRQRISEGRRKAKDR